MKFATLALLASSAAAFAPAQQAKVSTALNSGLDDLKAVAAKCNPVVNFYDPLDLCSVSIYDNDQDASIGWLRHAEIKHGRVAMFAFVGYIVHANGVTWPWPMTLAGESFPSGNNPPELWDALPQASKWQIILMVGFLEMFSEMAGTHYMRGGVPGKFADFDGGDNIIPHPVPFNLYDPFGISKNKSAEDKASGLIAEINNGRLAMIGIMGFLAEQKLEGSVPLLTKIGLPHYDGEPMAPF